MWKELILLEVSGWDKLDVVKCCKDWPSKSVANFCYYVAPAGGLKLAFLLSVVNFCLPREQSVSLRLLGLAVQCVLCTVQYVFANNDFCMCIFLRYPTVRIYKYIAKQSQVERWVCRFLQQCLELFLLFLFSSTDLFTLLPLSCVVFWTLNRKVYAHIIRALQLWKSTG